jgi:hypothetical protein
MLNNKWIKIGVLLLFGFYFASFFTVEQRFTNLDQAKLVKYGEVILAEGRVFTTNLFSYSYPDHPFMNHHWGSGALFFLFHQLGGLNALTVFAILCNLVAFFLMMVFAMRRSNFWIVTAAAIFLLPMLVSRFQPRPEHFSILFFVVNITLLYFWYRGNLKSSWLWILPVMQLLWVNIHILFYFGLFLQGTIWLQLLIIREQRRRLVEFSLIIGASVLASLINPSFVKGVFYPLMIMGEIQYAVSENLSFFYVRQQWSKGLSIYHAELTLFLAVLYLYYFIKNPKDARRYLFLIVWVVTFSALFLYRVRANVFLAYTLLIVTVHLASSIKINEQKVASRAGLISGVVLLLLALNLPYSIWKPYSSDFVSPGFGVDKQMHAGAEFFIRNGLKGPIFNNFDIGDYLIYHLYPVERVFVDSRPEAYPQGFFSDELVPVFTDQRKWLELDYHYKFNVVFLGYHQQVINLVERLFFDDGWFMMYNDDHTIIFLRRTRENDHHVRRALLQYKSLEEIKVIFEKSYDEMMRMTL